MSGIIEQLQDVRGRLELLTSRCEDCQKSHSEEIIKVRKESEDSHAKICTECREDRKRVCVDCKTTIKATIEAEIKSTLPPVIPLKEETPVAPSLFPAPQSTNNRDVYDVCLELRAKWFGSSQDETFEVFVIRLKNESLKSKGKN